MNLTLQQLPDSEWCRQRIREDANPRAGTVLVVDDDLQVRRSLVRLISAHAPRISVYEAENGSQALERIAEIRTRYYRDPLAIVLDLDMPVMSGWTLIKRLRKEYEQRAAPAGIPIIVFSSTNGSDGRRIAGRSVHEGKTGYTPLVTVAKDACEEQTQFDAAGRDGLLQWLDHYVKIGNQNRRDQRQAPTIRTSDNANGHSIQLDRKSLA